jgi:general secretion pathway protein D
VCCLLFALAACGIDATPTDKIDPTGNLSRRDYQSLHHRAKPVHPSKDGDEADDDEDDEDVPTKKADKAAPPIPSSPVKVALPPIKEPELKDKIVSLSVTDAVPLRDVLISLGREANISMEIDPRISGGVIFSAKNQPFNKVLKRLCDLAGLRFSREDGAVRIEIDEPFQKAYPVDYLSLARKATSEVGIATNVFDIDVANAGSSGTRTSTSNNNNSISKISGTADADFWAELEKSLTQVLASAPAPRILVSGSKNEGDKPAPANFSIDRQAGLVTVFGNERQHLAVADYLQKLQKRATAQVLIEARIIEVELDEAYKSGINWRTLFGGAMNAAGRFGAVGNGAPFSTASSAADGVFTASLKSGDIAAVANFVKTFGTTRVLSSPRLTVINNQTAVLKVARNEVYFITTAQYSTSTNSSGTIVSGTPVFTSTPKTVPVGLVMTVQPAIDSDHDKVTMTLRPSVSRIVDRVDDPSIALNAAEAGVTTTVQSQIPVLAVREMDSVVQLKSGEVAVMGGLMQDSSINTDSGVPGIDTTPIIGDLFKSRDNSGSTSELVVLLRATILDQPQPDEVDADLYGHFGGDPRAFPMPAKDKEKSK